MNCTNQNQNAALMDNQNEISPLKARLNRMAIHVPGNFPTPAEVIPIIEARLAAHMKHISRTASSTSGDYVEWKQIHDAYAELLTDLRIAEEQGRATRSARAVSAPGAVENPKSGCVQTAPQKNHVSPISPIPPINSPAPTHQNNFSPQNPPQSGSTLHHQHPTVKTELGFGGSLVGSAGFVVGSGGFKPTSTESNPPKQTSAPAQSDAAKDQPFDIREHLDAASLRVCEDFQEFLSGRSPIDNLTPQQQNVILLLLEEHNAARVAEVLAQPEPYGMNFKTSDSSLNRFRERIRDAEKKRLNADAETATKELIAKAHESDEAFQAAVQRFIKTRLLNATSSAHSSLDAIDSMITSLTKLRKQTLAERKQSHAEKTKMNASQNPHFTKNSP